MPLSRFRPRFTVRRLMIAVAIAALLLMPIVWFIQFQRAMHAFYGPGGTLERESQGKPATGPEVAPKSPEPK